MTRTRVLAALVMAPAAIAAIMLLSTPWLAALAALVLLMGLWEWLKLAGVEDTLPRIVLVGLNLSLMVLLVWASRDASGLNPALFQIVTLLGALAWLLWPLSIPYRLLVALRQWLYQNGWQASTVSSICCRTSWGMPLSVMNTRRRSMSSRSFSRSVTYWRKALSVLPRYFFATPSLPSCISRQGFSPSILAPSAVRAEHLPPRRR